MGVWNAIECWFLARLVLGIRSSVGTLALPLRMRRLVSWMSHPQLNVFARYDRRWNAAVLVLVFRIVLNSSDLNDLSNVCLRACRYVCMHVYVSFDVEISLYAEVDWIPSNCLHSAKTNAFKWRRSKPVSFIKLYFLPIWCCSPVVSELDLDLRYIRNVLTDYDSQYLQTSESDWCYVGTIGQFAKFKMAAKMIVNYWDLKALKINNFHNQ